MKRSQAAPRGDRAGFSLIELVIVIVIIGIMVAMAAPAMTGWVRQTRLDAALNQVTTDIAYSRMIAVRAGESVTIKTAASEYVIQRVDQSTPAKRVSVAAEHPGLTITMNPEIVEFDSRGLMRTGSATIVVADTHSGRTATLQITATGRVRRVQ